MEDRGPHLVHGLLGLNSSPQTEPQLVQPFWRAHSHDQQTDKQTLRKTVAIGHTLCYAQQCGLVIDTL